MGLKKERVAGRDLRGEAPMENSGCPGFRGQVATRAAEPRLRTMERRQRFTTQQKAEAIVLALTERLRMLAAFKRLGIHATGLELWIRQAQGARKVKKNETATSLSNEDNARRGSIKISFATPEDGQLTHLRRICLPQSSAIALIRPLKSAIQNIRK